VDTEANVNFLLPLADWQFGTMRRMRRTLTPEELRRHGPLEEAKAHPVGMSEPAKNVARPRWRENASPRVACEEGPLNAVVTRELPGGEQAGASSSAT
jgi:hypothetical protein